MKLKALSHYDNDMDTRFGDCILLYDEASLVVYDCGHSRHAQEVEAFLEKHSAIKSVDVVVSHNDSDHTGGVCELLNRLNGSGKYTVRVFTHQYLKYVDKILDTVDDGRRNRGSLKKSLLEKFDHIKEIIETADACGFECVNAVPDTAVGECTIVGPTEEEFIEVAAKAIDSRESDNIGEGDAQETVMNAASVQLKCTLSDKNTILLCGDASPDYLHELDSYVYIQLPHHGQLDDGKAVFAKLGAKSYRKTYFISDNSGSAATSGGSADLTAYMKKEQYTAAYNTQSGIVDLPSSSASAVKDSTKGSVCLVDLDYLR